MTVGQKVIGYIAAVTIFLLWEIMFTIQMFRDPDCLYITMLLFGIVMFLWVVRVLRHEPLLHGDNDLL